MWHLINLLFLALCFFTENISCQDPDDDNDHIIDKHASHERPPIPDIPANQGRPPIPDSYGGGDSHEEDNENPEGHRDGKVLIVVLPVVGFVVLLILLICGLCIVKKYNQKKIKARNYQENGTMEKHQSTFPTSTIFPDNPPPYMSKMEEGEKKSTPMQFLGFGTGWYAPAIVSMPPPYTTVVDQAFLPDSTAAPGY